MNKITSETIATTIDQLKTVLDSCRDTTADSTPSPMTIAVYGAGFDPLPSPFFWNEDPGTSTTTTTTSALVYEQAPQGRDDGECNDLMISTLEWLAGIGEYPAELRTIIGDLGVTDLQEEGERDKVLERVVVRVLSWVLGRIGGQDDNSGQSKVE